MNITKNFTLRELTYSQTAIKNEIPNIPKDPAVLENLKTLCEQVLEPLREGIGMPIRITSGYRSIALNKYIGGAKTSQHNTGEAVDFDLGENNAKAFEYIANNLEFDQMIWEFGTDENPDWVHVSFRKGQNRKQLLKAYRMNKNTHYMVIPKPENKEESPKEDKPKVGRPKTKSTTK